MKYRYQKEYIIYYLKNLSKNILTISFKDIIYALRWELGISNKFKLTFKKNSEIVNNSKKVRTPKLSVEAKLQSIAKALSILKNAKLIQISEFNLIDLETTFTISFIQNISYFDKNINNSDFAPIKGTKQVLQPKMKTYYKKSSNRL